MSRRSLLVLMWKHLMVRKRRCFHTLVDFLIPIMFFCIMFRYRNQMKPPPLPSSLSEDYDYKVQVPDVQYLSNIPPPRRILYYPSNMLTDTLMDEVGKKLNLRRLDFLPDHSMEQRKMKGYYGITDMLEITDYLQDIFSNEAIVEFQNLEDEVEWPAKLSYSIRIKNMFYTNSFEPFSGKDRPHRQFGEVYEEFLRLQWTIDTSYIKVVTNNDVNQTISMQEFPYYGTNGHEQAELTCFAIAALCFIACFTPFVFLMSRLLEQRSTGIEELIKMVGVTPNMISLTHFLNVLPVALFYAITVTVLLKTGPNALVEHSSGSIMFIILFLHHISIISMSFVCSYLTQSTQYSTSISVFAYIATWLPSRLLGEIKRPPRAIVGITGILPHVPLNWYWDEVGSMEKYGEGITWSEVGQYHTAASACVALAIFWLLFQITVFSLLAWYLSYVRPGPHGMPLPWNFIFKKDYWAKNEVKPQMPLDEEEQFVKEDKYFEPPPKHMEVGITIDNVSKVFPKHRALSNVSLDVYKGEICVLLGHNGAGKTTLMSIITGMLAPTEGKVLVKGVDIRRNKEKIHKEIGLCPQHNLFFPDLTVLEHTMFFTMLKKGTYREARASCLALIQELGLEAKANTKSSKLSGGMKRRLQLACALAGGADVLVLDEPTAGLDVETRRSLWDLLLSLRGSRTVLLSTHFMEEADALGDRIAALHHGRLRCCATTLFLKKAIGTGYRLSLTTAGPPHEAAITAVVTASVPDASLSERSVNALAYNLPSASSQNFPRLFTSLENQKTELAIESIGVGVSTLEEVFIKLCSDTNMSMTEDEIDSSYKEPKYNKVRGFPWCIRIMWLLLKRQIKFCLSKKITFFLLQILLPVVMICAFTATSNDPQDTDDTNKNLTLGLDMYKSIPDAKVLYNVHTKGANVDILEKEYPKFKFRSLNNDVAEGVLRTGKEDILEYNKYIAGIELNDTDAKILYTSLVRHAAPVAMNLLTNLLAAQYMPKATGHTITANNHPIAGAIALQAKKKIIEPKNQELCVTWSLLIVFVTLSSLVNLAALPCRERTEGSRHIHLMAGCTSVLHWGTTLLTHVVLSAITIILTLVVALYFIDQNDTFNNIGTVGCVIVLVMLGILAFLASMYIVTFWMGERATGIFLVVCLILFGLLTPGMHAVILFTSDGSFTFKSFIVNVVSWLAPAHALTVGLAKAVNVARLNAYCTLNRDMCPNLLVPENGFDTKACCSGGLPRCYFCWDDYSPAPEMVHLVVQFIVYMIIVILIQEGLMCTLYERIRNSCYKPKQVTETDDMVRAEKDFVDKKISLSEKQIESEGIALLAHDLRKNYIQLWKSFPAVRGVSFSVKKGECFGLLGVNGAGKSTTFKMLTVEECPTKGRIFGNGYRAEIRNRGKYLRTLGYCPQFFGLDDFQTARDNLTLLLTCRGLDRQETESEVKSWIGVVGLEKFADRSVSGYSGGMRRRLGAAAALGVGGRLALLDEPTAGVDVAARRRVWAALRRVTPVKRAVLLTSHSMDEMEALCDRIAIMAAGRICALGSAHELRARHAAGHAVLLKLRHEHEDQVDSAKSILNDLKADFTRRFNCVMKDEHPTMLHYHINETLHYSHLFTQIEDLKQTYPGVLEDYSITETTLEEVFLSFAKAQSPDGELEELEEDEPVESNDPNKIV